MFTIRCYLPEDLPRLREITIVCFDGVAIDQNIEKQFGAIAGVGWEARKASHIDDDCAANPEGVFVAVVEDQVVGYITSRVNHHSRIGSIPNLAVDPAFRNRGIARALFDRIFAYLRDCGMHAVRIETLEQNPIGRNLYPREGFQEVARQIHFLKML